MTDSYTPTLRALVAATLLLATATLMLVAVNTARAAGALAIGACGAFGEAHDFRTVDEARKSALAKCQSDTCRVVTVAKRGCAAFRSALDGRLRGVRRGSRFPHRRRSAQKRAGEMPKRHLPGGDRRQARLRRLRGRFRQRLRRPWLGQSAQARAQPERGLALLLQGRRQGMRDPHLLLRRQGLIADRQ